MKHQRLCLDIISTLPPSIIETILCLVPIQEAVRTCILSKEWRYSWTKIPKLVFNEDTFEVSTSENQLSTLNQTVEIPSQRKSRKLLYAINQVMLLRQGPILEFTLDMDANDPDTCLQIDQIINHLSRNNTLKKLSLDLTHGYRLLLSIFSLHPFTDLYLRNCDVYVQPPFNGFGSLTSLCLHDVNIYTKPLLHLLSSCPLLKTLTLYICQDNIFTKEYPTIIELFECLPLIEHLTTWGWLIPCFAQGAVPRQLPTSLFNLKTLCLKIMCFIDEYGLPFLIMLMRSSPNLEKLKLELIPEGLDDFWEDDLDFVTKQNYSDVWLEHLNELEIEEFFNLKPESDFVKLILAKSPVLKKASIMLSNSIQIFGKVTKDEEMLILTTLLHSPHASPLVEIIVKHPE